MNAILSWLIMSGRASLPSFVLPNFDFVCEKALYMLLENVLLSSSLKSLTFSVSFISSSSECRLARLLDSILMLVQRFSREMGVDACELASLYFFISFDKLHIKSDFLVNYCFD